MLGLRSVTSSGVPVPNDAQPRACGPGTNGDSPGALVASRPSGRMIRSVTSSAQLRPVIRSMIITVSR